MWAPRVAGLACITLVAGCYLAHEVADGGTPVGDAAAREDAGVRDAGVRDAGAHDAGVRDAGVRDAGTADAGTHDAGPGDSGPADTGPADAGLACDDGETVIVLPAGGCATVDLRGGSGCSDAGGNVRITRVAGDIVWIDATIIAAAPDSVAGVTYRDLATCECTGGGWSRAPVAVGDVQSFGSTATTVELQLLDVSVGYSLLVCDHS